MVGEKSKLPLREVPEPGKSVKDRPDWSGFAAVLDRSNAMEIADRAGKLYDKVAGFVEDAEKIGRALDTAQRAHGDAMTKLSRGNGNVLSQTDMLKKLGARAQKALARDFDPEEDGRPAPGDGPARIEAAE